MVGLSCNCGFSPSVLLLLPDHVKRIQVHAEAAYPQECCGLLVGTLSVAEGGDTRQVHDAIATANGWNETVSEDLAVEFASYQAAAADCHSKADRFWIDPKDILRVQRQARDRNLDIVGVYHSHPEHPAVPSECDRTIAWNDYSYVILAVYGGRVADIQSWVLDRNQQFQAERMGEPTPDILQ